MKNRILIFLKTDLFKTSFFNGIANVIKILTGLISNKIVAVYLGPSGVALLGQFQNFVTLVLSLASAGINNGVTKFIAEYHDDEAKRKQILSTGFYIIIIGSVIASLVIFSGRFYFAYSILQTDKYASVFIVLAFTLVLFVLNSFLIATLNGYKQFRKIVVTNIFSSIFSLFVAIIMVIRFGVYGAFLGWILSQTLVFFITLFWVTRFEWFSLDYLTKNYDKKHIKKLAQYSLMTFTTVFATTFVQLQVRGYIMEHLSMQDAGYWQGIMRICDLYITFITTTLGIYYLPRLSELKIDSEIQKEVFKGYKFILPIVLLSSILMYILKDVIINILFSSSFNPMKNLFLFQLLGNIFKIASWLIAYLMLAKTMIKTYIVSEIAFGLLYYFLTILFVNKFGVVGVTYSYCLNFFLYFLTMCIIFRKILFFRY